MGIEDLLKIQEMGPGAIERQEAEGQKDFVANETLPKECPREQLEALGFVFGDEADDLFVNVQFPEGWTKKATDHSMHNDLIDPQGRRRGGIFYKAAFYDRSAHLHLTIRYAAGLNYDLEDGVQGIVTDRATDKILYSTDLVNPERHTDEYWEAQTKHEALAMTWLEGKFPDHKDVAAYW